MIDLCGQYMKRLQIILEAEGVTFNNDVIGLISKYAPDWRRVLNEAQRGSIGGSINSDILVSDNDQYPDLYKHLKNKDFKKMHWWVVNNIDVEPASIFRGIYDTMDGKVEKFYPQLILILVKRYQYKNASSGRP